MQGATVGSNNERPVLAEVVCKRSALQSAGHELNAAAALRAGYPVVMRFNDDSTTSDQAFKEA